MVTYIVMGNAQYDVSISALNTFLKVPLTLIIIDKFVEIIISYKLIKLLCSRNLIDQISHDSTIVGFLYMYLIHIYLRTKPINNLTKTHRHIHQFSGLDQMEINKQIFRDQ
jgi:hypothetical protein